MGEFCSSCGAELNDSARFCRNCGAKTVPQGHEAVKIAEAAPDVRRDMPRGLTTDATGKYHWYYELNLFTNPTAFFTCFKAFTLVVGIMSVIMFFILLGDGFGEAVLFMLKFFVCGLGGMTVLLALGYSVYAAIQGGKYCVVFEMDNTGVTHTQLAKQFKKPQVIAGLALLMGASRGSLSMMGTGLLAGSRSSMRTCFAGVGQIKVSRRRNVIYLRSGLGHNQVYVHRENFDEVLNYILERIPGDAKRKGIA